MSEILIATLGGVGALFFWGISDWLASKSSKKYDGKVVNLSFQLSGGLIMFVLWGISGEPIPAVNDLVMLSAIGALFTIAYISYIKGLSTGEAGVIVPLANTYPLFTILLTATFLTFEFTGMQIGSIALVILGAILLGTEKLNLRKVKQDLSAELFYALLTSLAWGAGFYLTNTLVDDLAWEVVLGTIAIVMAIYAVMIYLVRSVGKEKNLNHIVQNKIGLLAGILLTAGSITFYIAAEESKDLIIPAVIASGSPLVTSLLAAIFDKERIIITKRIGAVLVVVGVILLNL